MKMLVWREAESEVKTWHWASVYTKMGVQLYLLSPCSGEGGAAGWVLSVRELTSGLTEGQK